MKHSYALLIPIAAVVVGCASPGPVPVNFSMSHQKVARTAQHWNVVAEDVVAQTLDSISKSPQFGGRGVYVAPTSNTAFNVAFREFMITHLVNRSIGVSVCKDDGGGRGGFASRARDVEIKYDVQLVSHGARLPPYQPPGLTMLAGGVAVVRNVILGGDPITGTIGGIALAEWGAGHMAKAPQSEIIVTTTIVEDNRFVSRKSDIYYVPDADAKLFVQRVAARSSCPTDKPVAMTEEEAEAGREIARRELVERGMARTHPARGGVPFAYSY